MSRKRDELDLSLTGSQISGMSSGRPGSAKAGKRPPSPSTTYKKNPITSNRGSSSPVNTKPRTRTGSTSSLPTNKTKNSARGEKENKSSPQSARDDILSFFDETVTQPKIMQPTKRKASNNPVRPAWLQASEFAGGDAGQNSLSRQSAHPHSAHPHSAHPHSAHPHSIFQPQSARSTSTYDDDLPAYSTPLPSARHMLSLDIHDPHDQQHIDDVFNINSSQQHSFNHSAEHNGYEAAHSSSRNNGYDAGPSSSRNVYPASDHHNFDVSHSQNSSRQAYDVSHSQNSLRSIPNSSRTLNLPDKSLSQVSPKIVHLSQKKNV